MFRLAYLATVILVFFSLSVTAQPAPASIAWERSFGLGGDDVGSAIRWLPDGGYIVAGRARDDDGVSHARILRLDSWSNVVWSRTYGCRDVTAANGVCLAGNGGFAFVGTARSAGGQDDIWVVRIDACGSVVWSKRIGGRSADKGHCIERTPGGAALVR